MRSSIRQLAVIFALLAPLAACSESTLEPRDLDEITDLLTLEESRLAPPPPLSATGLVRAAVERVGREQGLAAAYELVRDLRRLTEALSVARFTGDGDAAATLSAALRTEEIRIVLAVSGPGVIDDVIDGVGDGLARAREEFAALNADAERADQLHRRATEQLDLARRGIAAGNAVAGLYHATYAAELLENIRQMLVASNRLPGLDQLFQRAIVKVGEDRGRDAARGLLAGHQTRLDEARAALAAGDRRLAQSRLETAREEQARIIVAMLGGGVAAQLIGEVDAAIEKLTEVIAAARLRGNDVAALERMLRAATELNTRARSAYAAGAAARALDLAGHAANLVDGLRLRAVSWL